MSDDPRIALADTVLGDSSVPPESSRPSLRPAAGREEELVGARIDHFQIESVLGVGGMGAVYLARDLSLDRRVALKMLRGAVTRPEFEDRLMREARAQAKLSHPNVVSIYYIGRAPLGEGDQGTMYFAMELVDAGPLDAILERGDRMHPEEARLAMLQVADALRAASRAGIVHRDIKPSNLLRASDGRVKIADFGLAKPTEGDVTITQEGAFVGSPLYISPEQASGEPLDARADMYSLGASFYHLLAGHPLFDGSSPMKVIASHLSTPPLALREAAPEVPPALERIVMRLLAKQPSERFQDYDALIEALEAAAPDRTHHAGFWIRATATAVDGVFAAGLIGLLGWFGMVVHLAHVTIGHALFGRTLGKALFHIVVSRTDGVRLGWGSAFVRTIASFWMPIVVGLVIFLSRGFEGLTTTIEQLRLGEIERMQSVVIAIAVSNGFLTLVYAAGLLLAAFHPAKRAMHDLLVGSIVRYQLPDR